MKPRFSLLLLFLYCFCFGQEKQEDSLLLDYYTKKNKQFFKKNWDSVEYFSQKGIALARKINDSEKIVFFSSNLGVVYDVKGKFKDSKNMFYSALRVCEEEKLKKNLKGKIFKNLGNLFLYANQADSALSNYNKSLSFLKNDTLESIGAKINIAQVYSHKKYDYKKSIDILLDLEPITKQKKSLKNLATIYSTIGSNFFFLEQISKAKEYYMKSRDIILKTERKIGLGSAYLNIGNVYGMLQKSDSALFYFKKSKETYIKQNSLVAVNETNISLLNLYMNMKDYDSAMKIINELESNKVKTNFTGKPDVLTKKSTILFKTGRKKEAEKIIRTAVKQAEESGNRLSIQKAYFNSISQFLDRDKEILRQFVKFDSINFVAFRKSNSKLVNDLEIKYQTQQKENKILKLANENEKQKVAMARTRLLLLSIIGLVALLGGIGYFIRHKRKQQQQLQLLEKTIEASDNEKNRIGRELHDGVASKILQLVHNAENLNEEYTHKLQNVYTEIRGLSHQLNQTPMHSEEPIFERLLEITDGIQQKVNLEITPISLIVREPTATHIYRIVQELVANTIKHAEASKITLNISQPDNNLILNYTDDGKGFTNEIKGKGLQNIEHRVSVLKGDITYKTKPNNGFSTQITIPV